MGEPNSLRDKAEKGEVTFPPYDIIQRGFKISLSELSFSQRLRKIAKARFTPTENSSHWKTIEKQGDSY